MGSSRLFLPSMVLLISATIGITFRAASDARTAFRNRFPEQHPGPPGTIRVRVRLIPIDVSVVDNMGKPVMDLKQADFRIFENGKPQEIKHFSVQQLTAEPNIPEESPSLRAIPLMELSPQSARTFLIFLGRGRHQRAFKCVDALIKFVRQDLLPQDRVAVLAYNRATEFTTDHEQVAQVLERYKKHNDKIEAWMDLRFRGFAAVYGSTEVPASWQSEIDGIFHSGTNLGYRRVPPGRITEEGGATQELFEALNLKEREEARRMQREGSGGGLKAGLAKDKAVDDTNVGPQKFERIEAGARSDLPFEEFAFVSATMAQDVQNLLTSIEYLRYMEGEKHLLFFTENGLFLPKTTYDKGLGAIANDARVAISTFSTGGVFMDASLFDSNQGTYRSTRSGNDRTFALYSLRNISESTGGRAAIHEDIGRALSRVNHMTRAQYLLGYYPTDPNWNGQYRRINVRVNRPGVKVFYRHGYYARDTLQPYDRQEFLAYSRIASAASCGYAISDLPVQIVSTQRIDSPGQVQTRVDLNVDVSRVRFAIVNDLHSGRIRIAFFSIGAHGEYLADDWQTVDMNLKEETYQRVIREGFPMFISVPSATSRQILKIVVYDFGSDRVGSTIKTLP